MGLLDGLFGNASELDVTEVQQEFDAILASGEEVKGAYQLIRDMFLFTSHRFILIDKQGLTGRKVEYHSVPYKSITHFKIETAGHFDLDAELKVWISGQPEPIIRELKKDSVVNVQKALANGMFE